jgi:hypothetical protein
MNFFDILRSHALRLPDSIATASWRHRRTTYRQLWSRIERGSSRLQGEWLVEPGDIVIYTGHAHPDALILWLSLARLGAALMPLESAALQEQAGALANRHEVRMLVHDDDLPAPLPDEFFACAKLSALIARRCEHQARDCPESTAAISLLYPNPLAPTALASSFSIDALLAHADPGAVPVTASGAAAVLALFDVQRLHRVILPALSQGLPLTFE